MICCCAARTLFPPTAAAQSDDETVYDLGPDITPPRVIKQVNPHYSGVRAVGSLTIALVVTSKGLPKDPRVVPGPDKDRDDKALDQSAVDAVKEWRFAPAQKNGKPIAVRVSVQLRFHEM